MFRNDRPRTAHASLRGDLHTPHDPASRATRALPLLIQMWAPAVALRPRRTRRPHLQPSGRRRGAAAGAGAPCGSPSRRTPRQPWRSAACGACSSSAGCRAPRRTWCGRGVLTLVSARPDTRRSRRATRRAGSQRAARGSARLPCRHKRHLSCGGGLNGLFSQTPTDNLTQSRAQTPTACGPLARPTNRPLHRLGRHAVHPAIDACAAERVDVQRI